MTQPNSLASNILNVYRYWKANPLTDKSANPLVGYFMDSKGIDEITEYEFEDGSKLVFEINRCIYPCRKGYQP